ncbi:histidine phosphatase superfamily [Chytridium lagenaria]|nr:histidine phosphatase superfamily [Chytridium lagenaria]
MLTMGVCRSNFGDRLLRNIQHTSQRSYASTKEAETYIGKNVCLSVTIIRHAETEMNAQPTRVLQGQADVPINASGQKQASAVAWRLKKETFDHIFCSDLTRAVQTANEVKTYHPDIGITLDRRLREMDLGDLTGMTWNEAKKMLKAEDQTFDQHLKRSGESNSDFEERVVEFYTDLIENYIVKPHRELMENALKSQGSGLTDQLDVHVAQEERRLSVITRSAGTTPRSSFPGPLPTPVRSLMPTLSWSAEAPQSERKSPARNQPSLLKLKRVNLLIITHGGWIQRLLKHLVDELGFPTEGESHARSFPKNTGVYRFSITKMMKRDGDYEWSGSFLT